MEAAALAVEVEAAALAVEVEAAATTAVVEVQPAHPVEPAATGVVLELFDDEELLTELDELQLSHSPQVLVEELYTTMLAMLSK